MHNKKNKKKNGVSKEIMEMKVETFKGYNYFQTWRQAKNSNFKVPNIWFDFLSLLALHSYSANTF